MEFKQGKFFKFRVASPRIHLGAVQVDLPEGAIVGFDGQTLEWGGTTYNVPALKGAVTAGWLVPQNDNVSRYVPKSAGVKVRPAQGNQEGKLMEIETSSDEEEVVEDYKVKMDKRREDARRANMISQPDEPEGIEISGGHDDMLLEAPEPVGFDSQIKFDVETEEEREVAHVGKNKAFTKTVVPEDASSEGTPIARLASPKTRTVLDGEAKVVSAIASAERTKKVEKLVTAKTVLEAKKIAKVAATEKFAWDLSLHWKKRVALALKYADRPDILEQIMEVETPTVIEFLKAELSKRGILSNE